MSEKKVQTTFRFTDSVYYKLVYIAKQEHRPINAQISYLAEKCIKEYEAQNGTIETPETEFMK